MCSQGSVVMIAPENACRSVAAFRRRPLVGITGVVEVDLQQHRSDVNAACSQRRGGILALQVRRHSWVQLPLFEHFIRAGSPSQARGCCI